MAKGSVLKVTAQSIDRGDRIEISIQPENMQNGGVRPDGDAHAATLDAPERHHGHSSPLCNELR